ncbi:hypothetical protein CY34DRAFT_738466 [Suillus luteus UH-Slu-Lm8-n1]|uniref:Unplaced genomic scaffold CY34scaffold_912, whole genome shotgun sequence n=1 Tax=Suillus luteus UH-Slu-Lm8-n1 TaxID=930992 RepID=A0A0D0AFQ7_9AGAM|nr:hypothetical protein CY34DRAFT_738466 [Suillus luteus UH-Slu-Lm8-n1]
MRVSTKSGISISDPQLQHSFIICALVVHLLCQIIIVIFTVSFIYPSSNSSDPSHASIQCGVGSTLSITRISIIEHTSVVSSLPSIKDV